MSETEAKWVERVREWRDSAKTAEEFAAGKPYKPSTLKWWRTQLQRREKTTEPTLVRAKPIAMAEVVRRVGTGVRGAAAAEDSGIVVEVSGARISIARDSDIGLLAKVVRALGTAL